MSNVATMILVLGGTLLFAAVLLYLSLPADFRTRHSKRRAATEAATVVAATSDGGDRSGD